MNRRNQCRHMHSSSGTCRLVSSKETPTPHLEKSQSMWRQCGTTWIQITKPPTRRGQRMPRKSTSSSWPPTGPTWYPRTILSPTAPILLDTTSPRQAAVTTRTTPIGEPHWTVVVVWCPAQWAVLLLPPLLLLLVDLGYLRRLVTPQRPISSGFRGLRQHSNIT